MPVYRYSATELMGVPLDNQRDMNADDLEQVMLNYGVDGKIIEPMDPAPITPYFWDSYEIRSRYYLSATERGKAILDIVDITPRPENSKTPGVELFDLKIITGHANMDLIDKQTVHMPTDTEVFVLGGHGSPRYAGKLCLYELLIDKPA